MKHFSQRELEILEILIKYEIAHKEYDVVIKEKELYKILKKIQCLYYMEQAKIGKN